MGDELSVLMVSVYMPPPMSKVPMPWGSRLSPFSLFF